jgi:hypothetical protein
LNIGDLTATLGVDSSGLRRAEGDMRSFASTADNSFSSAIRSALAYATAVISIAAAYRTLSDAATTGMKVETMGVVMTQIGKNVGVSTEALKYFTKEVESAGVTGMEAMSALAKAMTMGLNLNQMKEFTTRVRDVAVGARDAEGNLLNTSQTLMRVMRGIQSGEVETLRIMGVAVRGKEEVEKAHAASIGKTRDALNDAQKSQAMYNEFMRASEPLIGAAAAADETVGKQLASMARYSEAAKVALWDLFQPAMMQGVMFFTNAFKDLKTWADANNVALGTLGLQAGTFVGQIGVAALETIKWAAANFELIRALTELYIITKVMTWINGLQLAIRASATITVIYAGIVEGLIPVLFGAATASTVFSTAGVGMATAMTSATAAGAALNAMMITLLPSIVAASAALAIYGAYKTFAGKAGYSSPESMYGAGEPGYQASVGGAAPTVVAPKLTAPSASTLQMNSIMAQQSKYVAEANEAQARALAKPGGAGKETKGGKGEDAEINRLNSLFDTLTKSIAGLSGGKFAEIEANYNKTIEQIHKKTSDRVTSITELEVLAAKEKSLKLEKVEEEFQLKMAQMSGDPFRALQAEYDKDIDAWGDTEAKKAAIWEGYNRKWVAAEIGIQAEIANIGKAYLDTMAGLSPILTEQLTLKQKALEIDNKLALAAIEKTLAEKPYLEHLRQEMVAQQAMIKQAKEYALEREKWQTQGVMGGAKMWAMDRTNEMSTRTAKTVQEDLKGLEGWISTSLSTGFFTALKGTHAEFNKFFRELGDTFVKTVLDKITKTFTQTVFDFGSKGILGMLGLGKDQAKLGTRTNPMWVTSEGAIGEAGIGGSGGGGTPDFAKRAEKIGMTMGAGGGLGGGSLGGWSDDIKGLKTYDKLYDQMVKGQVKDWKMTDKLSDKFWKDSKKDATTYSKMQDEMIDLNQELFKADYLTGYQDSFTGMATGITGIWGTAQGLMTAAGASGESQRYATMASYGIQAVTLLYNIVAKNTLAKAWSAGASAYASTWEFLGFPLAVALAPVMAAIAFAGTLAAGSGMGGAGAGGGSSVTAEAANSPMTGSAGGDWQVGATAPRLVHQDETILPAWAAESWRNIVSRENTGGRPGENGGGQPPVVFSPTYHVNAIDARGVEKVLEKHGRAMVKIIDREVGKRGRRL